MSVTTRFVDLFFSKRRSQMEHFMRYPIEVQRDQWRKLLSQAALTHLGSRYQFDKIGSYEEFAATIPVVDYEQIEPQIIRMRRGERGVSWPGEVKWFAKSSGTTGSKSKFIPVTQSSLHYCHLRGPKDLLCIYSHLYAESKIFTGRTLTLGGSHSLTSAGGSAIEGDLSAILIENTPKIVRPWRTPCAQIALISDFEKKLEIICRETTKQRVTAFAGVPSWNLVMLNKILDYTGKSNILEVWPHMEVFMHGGVNFTPYREQYRRLFPSERMRYMESYNASEGFFAIQNDPHRSDMLLMLDYRIFYEFQPVASLEDEASIVPLEGVERGINYAIIISSSNGLWRYRIGDTVEFTSLSPYKIKITGRTKHYINAFGEEVIVDNAVHALEDACHETGAQVAEYTAGPIYMDDRNKGAHQWLVEFNALPDSLDHFTDALDQGLQRINSDYEAKRFKDTTLLRPTVTVLPSGTFYQWMKAQGKAGGQHKVPCLSNTRTYIEELLLLGPK